MKLEKLLNQRFTLKYVTLSFLVFTILSCIVTGIFQVVDSIYKINIYSNICFGVTVAILFTALTLTGIYQYKYEKYPTFLILNISSDSYIENFLKLFAKKKIGFFRYSEYIFWFSSDIKYLYLYGDNNELVNELYYGLRINDRGVSIASLHKSDFQRLCKKWTEEDKQNNLIYYFQEMMKHPKDLGRIFPILRDKNILVYFSVIIIHFLGCFMVSDKWYERMGNMMLCIPGDILVLCIYLGIIRETAVIETKHNQAPF